MIIDLDQVAFVACDAENPKENVSNYIKKKPVHTIKFQLHGVEALEETAKYLSIYWESEKSRDEEFAKLLSYLDL
jgi:hypothetical protein